MSKLQTIARKYESMGNLCQPITVSYPKLSKNGIPQTVSTKYVQVMDRITCQTYYVNAWGRVIYRLPHTVVVNN